jgi:hypothetical protein
MSCDRCSHDPQPSNFGSPRGCAFTDEGTFTPDNWNCGTISALLELERAPNGYLDPFYGSPSIMGYDESLDLIPVPEDMDCPSEDAFGGWIVLTRYKRRGKTSSAVHVGDFWPPETLTLALANAVLAANAQPVPQEGGDTP